VPVVFGTGGHRGVIGSGLTLLHVHAIVTALLRAIAGMSAAQRQEHFGTESLAEVQRRGFVLGHDNRLFNPEFSFYAASLLREAGYAVRYAGRVSSPELSLLVPRMGWAGSLNFTPSHNPFRWGGLKFAPADGGLAGGDFTDPLAAEANRLLQSTAPAAWPAPAVLEARIAAEAQRIEHVDVHDTYLDALAAHPVVRLTDLIAQLKALPAERRVAFVADPVWGAAVPVYQCLQRRMGAGLLRVLHTEVDPYFGGQVTEPNEQTLADALAALRATPAAFKVMIRNDPDSDRGLVGDEGGAVQMNRFAPLVFRYLRDVGQSGELVTTLPTSHLGPDYARAHGSAVVLTPTGFKNFRAHLKGGRALLAYEESNGLTIRGHTLDKDGVLAGLLALRIVLHYGRPLSALVAELEAELTGGAGHYHYRQETFTIDLSAAEAHQRMKKLGAVRPGETFTAGGRVYPIRAVNAEDGYKLTLDGGAWVMMRPSGTEPKVRVYAESRESAATTQALCAAARAMALAAVQSP
jgi:phosphomannomutase